MISLGRGSGLRARVATGPELNAHRREEPRESCRHDTRPTAVGKGTYYPQFHLLTRAPFPEEKKDHSLTFNTTHPYSDQLLLWYILFDISEADGDEARGTFSEHSTQSFFVKQMDLSVGCRVTL